MHSPMQSQDKFLIHDAEKMQRNNNHTSVSPDGDGKEIDESGGEVPLIPLPPFSSPHPEDHRPDDEYYFSPDTFDWGWDVDDEAPATDDSASHLLSSNNSRRVSLPGKIAPPPPPMRPNYPPPSSSYYYAHPLPPVTFTSQTHLQTTCNTTANTNTIEGVSALPMHGTAISLHLSTDDDETETAALSPEIFQLSGATVADATAFNAQVAAMPSFNHAPTPTSSSSNLKSSSPSPGFFYNDMLDSKKMPSETQGGPQLDCQLKVMEDVPQLDLDRQHQPLCSLISSSAGSNISTNVPRVVDHPTRLTIPHDEHFLDPVQNFLRSSCVEVFVCGSSDNSGGRGRGVKPRANLQGQIGLRCAHCKHVPKSDRAKQSVSYPSKTTHIYESVRNYQRIHIEACRYIPTSLKTEYTELMSKTSNRRQNHLKYVKVYFAEAAREIGMIESPYGLFFGAPPNTSGMPSKKLQAIMSIAQNPSKSNSRELQDLIFPKVDERVKNGKFAHIATQLTRHVIEVCRQEQAAFIHPSDFLTVSDFRFVLLHQFVPCRPPASKLERRKTVPNCWETLSGLCCKHCARVHHGHGHGGVYCPLDFDSCRDSSFMKYITTHILTCKHVPIEIKEALNELHMLAAQHGITTKRGAKTLFLKKLWDRMSNYYYCQPSHHRSTPRVRFVL